MADPLLPDPDPSLHITDLASDLQEIGVSKDLSSLLSRGLTQSSLPRQLRTQRASAAFQQAFEIIGGVPRLALWADRNPDKFYPLFARLIPQPPPLQSEAPVTPEEMAWVSARRLMYQMGTSLAQDIESTRVDTQDPPAND